LSSDISYISGLKGIMTKEMSPIVDLNIGVEYKFNEKIRAFVQANNLVSKKYQYFEGYSSQGINVLGGLIVNF
jgi:outer membrane cobalamin receptor